MEEIEKRYAEEEKSQREALEIGKRLFGIFKKEKQNPVIEPKATKPQIRNLEVQRHSGEILIEPK